MSDVRAAVAAKKAEIAVFHAAHPGVFDLIAQLEAALKSIRESNPGLLAEDANMKFALEMLGLRMHGQEPPPDYLQCLYADEEGRRCENIVIYPQREKFHWSSPRLDCGHTDDTRMVCADHYLTKVPRGYCCRGCVQQF